VVVLKTLMPNKTICRIDDAIPTAASSAMV
jgi:hypothetical protein